jgi:FkbM family methyltransferase
MPKKAALLLRNLSRWGEILTCLRETNQWLPLTLAYIGLRALKYPYDLRLRCGAVLTLTDPTELIIFWLVFARRHYRVEAADRVILDVGANVGFFTLYAARQAPEARIIAVEPFPETCHRLRKLLEHNHIEHRVTVLNYAIAVKPGPAEMDSAEGIPSVYRRIQSEAAASLNLNPAHRQIDAESANPGVPIQKATLGDMLEAASVREVDLMKMNIHGSEYEVLLGTPPSVLRRIRKIAVQYHEGPASSGMVKGPLFTHLGELGFRLVSDRDTRRGSGLAVLSQPCNAAQPTEPTVA